MAPKFLSTMKRQTMKMAERPKSTYEISYMLSGFNGVKSFAYSISWKDRSVKSAIAKMVMRPRTSPI